MRDRSEKRAPIGSPSRHSSSPRTLLLRAGFHDAARAGKLLGDPALLPFLPDGTQDDDVSEAGDTVDAAQRTAPRGWAADLPRYGWGLSVRSSSTFWRSPPIPTWLCSASSGSLRPPPPPNQLTGHRWMVSRLGVRRRQQHFCAAS